MIIIDTNIMAMGSDQERIITSEKLMLLPEMRKAEVQIPGPNHNSDLSLHLLSHDRVLRLASTLS